MNRGLPPVKVTGGPYAGRPGRRVCRCSDIVFVCLHTDNGLDVVEVPERQVEFLT